MKGLEIMMKVAWSHLGRPYKWGGDDPMAGFDCSGFVIECLKSIGLLPRSGDWTAAMLWTMFQSYGPSGPAILAYPPRGHLVFWQNSRGKVIHIELIVGEGMAIGAGGGGSSTLTNQDAIDQNAYIKVRPYGSRSGIIGFSNPWQPK